MKMYYNGCRDYNNEVRALSLLTHVPNIGHHRGCQPDYLIKGNRVATIIFDYYRHGDLLDILIKSGTLTEIHARTYFKQLAETIALIHDSSIFHLDLKTDNIVIDDEYKIRLIDFGFAYHSEDIHPLITQPKGFLICFFHLYLPDLSFMSTLIIRNSRLHGTRSII